MKVSKQIIDEINAEFKRQERLHGEANKDLDFNGWMLVLAEEYGEVAKEANELYFRDGNETNFRKEVVQMIAVVLRALYYKNRPEEN